MRWCVCLYGCDLFHFIACILCCAHYHSQEQNRLLMIHFTATASSLLFLGAANMSSMVLPLQGVYIIGTILAFTQQYFSWDWPKSFAWVVFSFVLSDLLIMVIFMYLLNGTRLFLVLPFNTKKCCYHFLSICFGNYIEKKIRL